MGDIGGGAFGADAVQRRLDQCVLFGVQRAHTMTIDKQVTDVVAVWKAGWRAVVAGGENASVAHQHTANMCAVACAALCDGERYLYEVLIP
ncbi:MAG: hypothetical protein BroJett021_07680 [Chloroflexota bacterium]|nr:MAG: hypothetical protein BroJett021_07680 [Chloroflexota bacterium]